MVYRFSPLRVGLGGLSLPRLLGSFFFRWSLFASLLVFSSFCFPFFLLHFELLAVIRFLFFVAVLFFLFFNLSFGFLRPLFFLFFCALLFFLFLRSVPFRVSFSFSFLFSFSISIFIPIPFRRSFNVYISVATSFLLLFLFLFVFFFFSLFSMCALWSSIGVDYLSFSPILFFSFPVLASVFFFLPLRARYNGSTRGGRRWGAPANRGAHRNESLYWHAAVLQQVLIPFYPAWLK